jgi:MFS family permease
MSVATPPHPTAWTRRRLVGMPAFAVVAAIIALALFASATPTPLYRVYQAEWHFSTLVLTLVYAVYCFGVLVALLAAGRLSDEVGRRPVLAGGVAGLLAASVAFALAESVEWLFAARLLQGLATGVTLGAAGAALLDLHPRGDGQRAGLVNGVVTAGGIGAGALVASLLVQYGPAPELTPFLLTGVLFALTLAATLALPESVERRTVLRLRVQAPRVPAAIRSPFAVSALGVIASWSVGGVYLSLGPSLAGEVLDTDNHLAGGLALLALALPAALTQLRWHGADARRAASVGAAILALGMALIVASLPTGRPELLLAASLLAGGGWGVAFMGALRSLTSVIPARHRAEVMSAFYVVAYLSISLPAIAAGLVVPELGLETTFQIFGSLVVAVALAAALLAGRARPVLLGGG